MEKKSKMTCEENVATEGCCGSGLSDVEGKSSLSDAQCHDYFNAKRLVMTCNVIGVTVGILALAFGIGFLVDMLLGTKPWFIIICILLSFPLAQVVIYKRLRCVLGSGKCASK